MGLMNGDFDDDDDDDDDDSYPDEKKKPLTPPPAPAPALKAPLARLDGHRSPPPPEHPQRQQGAIPLAAPRPGYVAPAVNVLALSRPSPAATPDGRAPAPPQAHMPVPQMAQIPSGPPPAYPRTPPAPTPNPTDPHPLMAPMTPIQPVFARPAKAGTPARDVKFKDVQIMRGGSEDALLPKRGEKGDDFWRRFSMVVHEDETKKPNEKQSSWLRKAQNVSSRSTRWVGLAAFAFFLCVIAGIGCAWYFSHISTTNEAPTALGGKANETAASSSASHSSSAVIAGPSSTVFHVSPTNTVARRWLAAEATAVADIVPRAPGAAIVADAPALDGWAGKRHDDELATARRRHLNRTSRSANLNRDQAEPERALLD